MMRQIFILFIITSVLKVTLGCASKSQDNSKNENKVVKIVKTKCYSTKPNFDKLTFDKPEYVMGYDKTMEMDFSWSIKYFDKYNNIIKLENFKVDSSGKETIYQTSIYEYYSLEKKLLSGIKTKSDYGNKDKKYIRNEKGQLTQLIENIGDKMFEKTIYTYNATGQKIKKEVYQEKGLKESYEYIYDTPQKDSGHVIKEIEINYNPNYKVEREFKWSRDGKNISTQIKEFENEKVISNLTFYNKKYVGDMVTEEIIEGYNAPLKEVSQDGTVEKVIESKPFRGTTVKTLNEHNDIVTYSYTTEDIDEKGQTIPANKLNWLSTHNPRIYECKYTYNPKGDWTELLFSADNQKYLIVREIKYLE